MQLFERQSPACVQALPFGRPHFISAAKHLPERHCVSRPAQALPFKRPHRLSVSQTPDAQTSAPAAALHVPSITGVPWLASVGMLAPFGCSAPQTAAATLHHAEGQSPSTAQALAAKHLPFAPQKPERQTVAALLLVHAEEPPLS